MKNKMKIIASGLLLMVALTGCGTAGQGTTADTSQDVSADSETSSQNAEAIGSDETTRRTSESDAGKVLVAVFSRTGENYEVGVIEKGNTMIVAEMVQEATGADLFEIVPENPYPDAYDEMLVVATDEQESDARPAMKGDIENIEQYDTIFIGYPIWWGDMPNIVKTFIDAHDFSGKTVIPFSTHAGSGLAGTQRTIQDMMSDADVSEGFTVSGKTAQENQERARKTVEDWLSENGF